MQSNKLLNYAIFTEGAALTFLFLNNIYGYFLFFLIHFISSFTLSVFLFPFSPSNYKSNKTSFLIINTLLIFSTFIIGFIASIILYTYILKKQEEKRFLPFSHISHQSFFDFPKIKRVFGESAARNMTGSDNYKVRLLTMLSDLKIKETLEVIHKGISEKNDEVRLTSFSILNKFTSTINNIIKTKLEEFENCTDSLYKSKLAKELAFSYWDLIYFGLSDKELEKYVISMIEKYTNIAIELNSSDAEVFFLKGKIYLYKNDIDEAEENFITSIILGYDKEKIYPYLAEVYFYKKDYKKIKDIMNELGLIGKLDFKLHPITSMWITK